MVVNSSHPVIRIESVSVATSPPPLPFPVYDVAGRWVAGDDNHVQSARARVCGYGDEDVAAAGSGTLKDCAFALSTNHTTRGDTTGPGRRPDSP